MDNITEIMHRVKGYSFPYYFFFMCDLKIFDILYEKSLTISEIADQIGISEKLLFRLLRPLKSINLINMDTNLKVSLTEYGEKFSNMHGTNYLSKIRFHEKEGLFYWENFGKKIKSSKKENMNENRFVEFSKNGDSANLFINMMESVSSNVNASEILIPRIKDSTLFVDVGGGTGTLSLNIVDKNPELKCIVYDLPHLESIVKLKIKKLGYEDRCTYISGDFFKSIPYGEFYILSRVLHDWEDKECDIILNNLRSRMMNGQKLFVFEKILPDEINGGLDDYMMDLNVFCMCGGQERTRREFDALFSRNGMRIMHVFNVKNSTLLKCMEISI